MMRLAGYSVTDLMDLQLGLTELNEIGFSQKDLYELGLTLKSLIYISLSFQYNQVHAHTVLDKGLCKGFIIAICHENMHIGGCS